MDEAFLPCRPAFPDRAWSFLMPAPALPPAVRRALAILLAAAVLALVASSSVLHEWLVGFLPAAEEVIRERPVLGAVVFVAWAAFSAMFAFVSSAIIVPVSLYVWGKGLSMLLLWLGWILGGVFAYSISRYFGRTVVDALRAGPALERYEARISRRASFGLVLLFQLAVPSEVPGYLLGLMRYSFWKYLAALALAELPYAVVTVYLGHSFLERRTNVLLAAGAGVAVLSAWALYTLHGRIAEKRLGDRASLDSP